jgi:hypothetical protein
MTDINYLLSELQNVLNEATDSDYAEGLVDKIEKYVVQNTDQIDQIVLNKINNLLKDYKETEFDITDHVNSGYYRY